MDLYFKDGRIPKVGDVVCHYIYTRRDWMAIIIETEDFKEDYKNSRSLVRMIPGVVEEDYFVRKNQKSAKSGWVYTKWLWVLSRA